MTGSSGPSACLETLAGGTGPSRIFSQALAEDKSIASVRNQNPGGKNRWNLCVRGPGERQQRNCCRCVASVKKSVFLLIFGVGGGTPRRPESAQGTPEVKAKTFHRFSIVPGPVSEAVWGHLGHPMATFGDAWAHRWPPRDTKKRMRDRTRCPTRSRVRQRPFPEWLFVMKT